EVDESEREPGTIYTVGIAPSARWSLDAGSTRFVFKTGVDAWTKMYSRAQKTSDFEADDNESRLGLDTLPPEQAAVQPTEIEDYAQHYFSQAVVGVTWDRL